MLFATGSDFGVLGVIFIGMLLVCFIWLILMATFKPKQLGELYEMDRKRREEQDARRKAAAKGAMKVGSWVVGMLKKK